MSTFAEFPVLRHGLVRRWHLGRRVDVSVQMQTVERCVVHIERLLSRNQNIGGCLRICLENGLNDRPLRSFLAETAPLIAADDGWRQGRADSLFVVVD